MRLNSKELFCKYPNINVNLLTCSEGGGGAQEAAWCDEDTGRVGQRWAGARANRIWKGKPQHSHARWNRRFQKYVKWSEEVHELYS